MSEDLVDRQHPQGRAQTPKPSAESHSAGRAEVDPTVGNDRQEAGGEVEPIADVLRAAGGGDEEAWRKIVHLYARRVYALARSRLGGTGRNIGGAGGAGGAGASRGSGHDAAEEVTQSVFVTVAAKLSSGEYTEQGRFESWLFRVAMNRIRDEVRRLRRHATPTDPETLDASAGRPEKSADLARDREDSVRLLRGAIEHLAETDREVIELRHHAGLSFKQMAELLDEPLGTLLARHHRALRKLKDIILSSGEMPTWLSDSMGSSS